MPGFLPVKILLRYTAPSQLVLKSFIFKCSKPLFFTLFLEEVMLPFYFGV